MTPVVARVPDYTVVSSAGGGGVGALKKLPSCSSQVDIHSVSYTFLKICCALLLV
jgi:hypothetical protein